MGGVGKTTLVQLVYNDERLNDEFDLKAWACVSDDFNALRVTKSILEAISSQKCDYENFNTFQVKLKESLSRKKFLIVLDDIWNENYGDWDILRRPFLAGESGSKIIITTRQEKVAKIMSQIPAYHLAELSEDDALSLLAQHALGVKTFDTRPDLREIGKFVVRRCNNLPLAIKALGGLLRTRVSPKEWEEVLKTKIWMAEETSEILPALKLSYQYLPPQVKRCFAYCALFPKDYEFDKFQLVHLWIAEGLVRESENYSLEELGSQYFNELLARSFFQQSSANASRFVMHELVNDLAMFIAGGKCLRMDVFEKNLPSKISEKARHFSFSRSLQGTLHGFTSFNKVQQLRTFMPLPVELESGYVDHLSQRILLHLLPKLNCLHVLSLYGYQIYELPDSIGDLTRLRYLNLGNTLLKRLPESVSTLINLKLLILRHCRRLTKLPSSMEDLIHLFHLDISATDKLQEMPQGIAQLTSLRTLSKMIVRKSGGMRLKDLGKLSLLEGEISVEELQNVQNVQEAMDAKIMDKPGLNRIRLAWSYKFDDSRIKNLELGLLDALKPHGNLSRLEIEYYGGEKFSQWIGDSAFIKLEKISFKFCRWCTALPPLGQLPLLRDLSIQGMDHIKAIGAEFCGHGELSFQSLNSLTFEDMTNWEEWHGIEGIIKLPQLCNLYLRKCPRLVRLPDLLLPSLCELEATQCNEVVLNHMHNLESLTHLRLRSISGLTSVFRAFLQFPFTLETIEIVDCDHLVNLLPNDSIAQSLVNLRQMFIERCPLLLSLPELVALKNMKMRNCEALELLPNVVSSLEELEIRRCPSLKMMATLQGCSTSLDYLTVHSWENLNLINLLGSGNDYTSLTYLCIDSCDRLESFPYGGLPTPNLRFLTVRDCQHLKSLPNQMELLLSLEGLDIDSCPSLVELFPPGNIPPNLSDLRLRSSGNLKPVEQWNLDKLTALTYFSFRGYPELVSFTNNDDEQRSVLPPSLTKLRLEDLPNLESISKGFQNLTCLQSLNIFRCQKLATLPMEDQIDKLYSLWIGHCPLLKRRCLEKNRGGYWPIIANIPEVYIDGRSIFDPDSSL